MHTVMSIPQFQFIVKNLEKKNAKWVHQKLGTFSDNGSEVG